MQKQAGWAMSNESSEMKTILYYGPHSCFQKYALCLLSSVYGLLFTALPAVADVILGDEDINYLPASWSSEYGWASVTAPVAGGVDGSGWFRVGFSTIGNPEAAGNEWYDTLHVPAANIFAGAWSNKMRAEFDFWASSSTPRIQQAQWKATNNTNIWGGDVTPAGGLTRSNNYVASFENFNKWKYPGASLDQYLSDLNSRSWIGVYNWRTTPDDQISEIDNYRYWISEPVETGLLAVAVAIAILAVRRRRGDEASDDSGESS